MMPRPGTIPGASARTAICGPSRAAACAGAAEASREALSTRRVTQRFTAGTLLSQERQKRPELDLGLGQLGGWVGAGHYADSGEEVGLAVA